MNRYLVLILCVAFSLSSCSEKRKDVTMVSGDDAEMNAAMEKGRSTLGLFKEQFKSDPKFGGLIKVYFQQSGKDGEHMWVHPVNLDGEKMEGVLIDTPAWLTNVKAGDSVTFSIKEVSDWLYIQDGKAVGAYTVRLLRSRMTDAERKEHDSAYPFSID